LGGGGYNPWTVTRYWTGLWGTLSGRTIPVTLPEAARTKLAGLQCDLIDDDDVLGEWRTSLADPPNEGRVREQIKAMRDQVLRQTASGSWDPRPSILRTPVQADAGRVEDRSTVSG
jgi:acetoin utilization protein AcuC